jgi:2-phospho-L-lactate/phosphoenolpyruvate guanylyltransferase
VTQEQSSTVPSSTGRRSTGPDQAGWTLVLPVQRADRAKSRLRTPPGVARPDLARAIAADSLAAARGCPAVAVRIVVTSDEVIGPLASGSGDVVIADPGTDLAAAVAAGVAHAAALRPLAPVAVLLADVPAARPQDLTLALAACAGTDFAVLADLDGTGTVLLGASSPARLRPAFGAGSAGRHHRSGATVLDLDLPRLRRDVDTASDLQHARALGLGRATNALLLGNLTPVPDLPQATVVQATVHEFDDRTGAGSVLLDDGRRLPFDSAVFAGSELRRLRVGQRLTVGVSPAQAGTTGAEPGPRTTGPQTTGPQTTGPRIIALGITGVGHPGFTDPTAPAGGPPPGR